MLFFCQNEKSATVLENADNESEKAAA